MANPKCPYFGECGGCSFQHVDYEIQLQNKKKALAGALSGVGAKGGKSGFKEEDIRVFSDSEYGYRNRMDFAFWHNWIAVSGRELSDGDSGRDRLGFRKKGKWFEVVDVCKCAISEKRLNDLFKEVRKFFVDTDEDLDAFDIKKKTGTFRYAVVRTPKNSAIPDGSGTLGSAGVSGGDSSICFVLNSNSTRLDEAINRIKKFAKVSTAKNISVLYVKEDSDLSTGEDFFVVKGGENLNANLTGKVFEFSVQGFFQNNSKMAEKMHEYVHELFSKNERGQYSFLLDLYGGVGTFGINNADLFYKVLIVEAFAPAIESAKRNIERNGVKNIDAMVLDAQYLRRLSLSSKDLYVITDPPRSGMHPKTIECLRKLKPKVIIYISCNVEQLKSDLPKFKDYKVASAAVFDLFPQTPHMESVVELEVR